MVFGVEPKPFEGLVFPHNPSRLKGDACQNLPSGLGGMVSTVDEVVWLSHSQSI